MARTDSLTNFLTDVANSIRKKSETTEQIKPENFDRRIASLPGKYKPTRISFENTNFEDSGDMSAELEGLDTSQVRWLNNSFSFIRGVPDLSLSFNTSNVEDFSQMFYMSEFQVIGLYGFTFDSVIYGLGGMFSGLSYLTTLILDEGWLGLTSDMLAGGELFDTSPIAIGEGFIYVPAEYVDQFKTHEVFSQYANQIKSYDEM